MTLWSSSANVIASAFLVFTTLKAFSDFGVSSPFSTLFFVGLATFPTFFADAIRRFGLVATSERYYLWQQSANRAYTFFGIATSFAYKQEVLLFGLRDWIIESWAKFKEESDKVRGPDQELFGGSLMVTGVPENIIKDLLYVCPFPLFTRAYGLIFAALPRVALLLRKHHPRISSHHTEQCL